MTGGEVNPYPIQLLVNYWEACPSVGGSAASLVKRSQLAERLDRLIRLGVKHIATFVPWQLVESDISHMLVRFLQATSERGIGVSLILTPEVGVHYPNSGLPRDLASRSDDVARDCANRQVMINLPPTSFSLPSLFSPEFNKRYYSFLSRMDSIVGDLKRTQPRLVEGLTMVVTGSYWKYYRSPYYSSRAAFGGPAGDYSGSAALAFRQRLEQFFSQREFLDPDPFAANRWKARTLEEVNRRWFYQQSEDVFRNRSVQLLRKKANQIPMREIELFTPEADPAFTYARFLQAVSGAGADASRLSQLVEEAASRETFGTENRTAPYLHWSALGGFRSLADAEKQFLVLKSLLLLGGQGGGILVDESDWFSFSHAFRTRAEGIAKLMTHGELKLRNRAVFFGPHVWSNGGTLWEEMFERLGCGARLVASLDAVLAEKDATLCVVDPSVVMTRELIVRLTEWAQGGRLLVLPRSPLYTESGRRELESLAASSRRIELDLGIPYHLHALGKGKLVIYELPEKLASMTGESRSSWQAFLGAMLSVAGVETYCQMSDSRIHVIPMEKGTGSELGLFILNETYRQVAADIVFPRTVAVSDFAAIFSTNGGAPAEKPEAASTTANRFSLEVAPYGILSLAVEGAKGGRDAAVPVNRGAAKQREHGTDA